MKAAITLICPIQRGRRTSLDGRQSDWMIRREERFKDHRGHHFWALCRGGHDSFLLRSIRNGGTAPRTTTLLLDESAKLLPLVKVSPLSAQRPLFEHCRSFNLNWVFTKLKYERTTSFACVYFHLVHGWIDGWVDGWQIVGRLVRGSVRIERTKG